MCEKTANLVLSRGKFFVSANFSAALTMAENSALKWGLRGVVVETPRKRNSGARNQWLSWCYLAPPSVEMYILSLRG